jgi:hypothetical protein
MRSRHFFPLVLLALILWGGAGRMAWAQNEHVYYLSPAGDDANDGSLAHPWATVTHALTQLTPGDTLQLRQGVYREHNINLDLHGTAAEPIIIESYPGERAKISGGIDTFLGAPNARWQLVEENIQLYRSIDVFSASHVYARLVDDDINLIEYTDAANLESTHYGPVHGQDPLYQGPGIQLRDDGHLYIRLTQNPNDLTDPHGDAIPPVPVDVNPNHNNIEVFFSGVLFYADAAEYVHFRNLDFAQAHYLFDVRNASHHLSFTGCKLFFGSYGVVVREGSDFQFSQCQFDGGLPQYVYWTDVKNYPTDVAEPYPELQSKAISGVLTRFEIRDCLFQASFDGVGVADDTVGAHILGNHFIRLRDDALDLRAGIADVEIAHNMLWGVGSGISMTGTPVQPSGPVYIHHNVIDVSIYQHGGRTGNFREDDWPTWNVIDPFGSHGDDMAAGWKVYNNTIVTRKNGYETTPAGPHAITGNPQKYLYNNIFLVLDDRTVFSGDHASSGTHYDGDVFYRLTTGPQLMFRDFGDGGDYSSLAAFRAGAGTNWESNGLELDPQLDMSAITDATYDAETIWQRYAPANLQMYTRGATYTGLAWPESKHNFYRGALAPVHLVAAADDAALHLAWELTATLPISATWRIRYQGPAGDEPSPIARLDADYRGYTLSGLSNAAPYTITLNAMVGGSAIITDAVTATPLATPTPAPALTLMPADPLLYLSWQPNEQLSPSPRYWIWHSTSPYFGLSHGPEAIRTKAPWQFEASALGNPAENHFYRVMGLADGAEATISGLVGEFDFALTPGASP